jgi:hypothetical protein
MLWVHISPAPHSPRSWRRLALGLSALTRLAWAAAVCGLLWLAIWWALA